MRVAGGPSVCLIVVVNVIHTKSTDIDLNLLMTTLADPEIDFTKKIFVGSMIPS